MGGYSSKGEPWPYGNILLQLTKIDYLPGEVIKGMIHLQLNQPFPGNCIKIKFKGREFTHYIVRRSTGSKHDRTVTDHYRNKIETYNSQGIIYIWPTISIPAGQYTFPFEMLLPPNLPASFFFRGFECMGMIWYNLKAYAGSSLYQKVPLLENKQMISIIQPLTMLDKQPFYQGARQVYKCCICCCDAGPISIIATAQKATFIPNEEVRLELNIDASACTVRCLNISISLKQNLTLVGKYRTVVKSYYLTSSLFPGIEAGQKKMNEIVSLKLPPPEPYHFGGTKEDAIVAGAPGTINSTTKGQIVDCSFTIDVLPIMDNCCVKAEYAVSIPIIINSSVFPPINPIQAPPEWNPQIMDTYRFSYTPEINQNLNSNMNQFNQQNQIMYAPLANDGLSSNLYIEKNYEKPIMSNY